MEATRIITKYESDIPLLEDIYLKYITYSENEDSHGEFLAEIVKRDSEFLNRYLEEVLKKSSHFYSIHETWVKRLEFIWKLEIYMSAMDKVSDYILERNPEIYRFVIRDLLTYPQGNTDIEVKQEKWIRNTIERYCFDSQRMYRLFSSIAEHSADRRRGALKRFLELNNDYTLFEQLPLEASSWGGYGSMIPYMQERITYLTSLLPMLSGLEFLRHKQRVEQDIEIWRIRIREEEIEELLESMG